MIQRVLSFTFFALCLVNFSSKGQDAIFRSFEAKYQGNKFRLNTALFDSKENFLLGTNQGLMLFDHYEFKPAFVHDSSNSIEVQSLYEGNNETIWIGYKNGRIGKLVLGNFSWLSMDTTFPTVPVTGFVEDKSGNLYVSTLGEGIFIYTNGKFSIINTEIGLSDDFCYNILMLAENKFCVSTDQGINFFSRKGNEYEFINLSSDEGLPDNIVRNIQYDKEKNLWVSLHESGYCKINPDKPEILETLNEREWKFGQVNCIQPLEDEVWIGTESSGIIRRLKNGRLIQISNQLSLLNNESVRAILPDRERNVWIVSGTKLIRSSGEAWSRLPVNPLHEFSFIHCILADRNGDIWFSPDQQLYRARMTVDGGYEYKKYQVTGTGKLTDIVTLYEDKYGNIWIGTLGEGVFVLNPKSGKIKHPAEGPLIEKGNILSIEEHNDIIRIGGFEGIRSFTVSYDPGTSEYVLKETEEKILQALNNNYIYTIHTDLKGRTWIGTDDNGLVCIEDDKLILFDKRHGLSSNTVLSITSAKNGDIWLATQGNGISTYDGKKFTNISIREGLSDPSPSSVIIDRNDRVLIVHNNGVDILDPVSKTFHYYSSESGLGEIRPDLNVYSISKDGKIFIGTERDIFIYKPSSDTLWAKPHTQINKVLLYLQPVASRLAGNFNHDQNNISIEFNAPWYSEPNRTTYSYQLEGYSSEWLTTKDHSVSYPRLPPGNYIFRVRSSLNELFNSSIEATYHFKINAPFWQTTWFRISLSLFILAIIWYVMRRRETRLRKEEKQEQEKIEIQFETLRSQVNPHFLFNSFNTLITVIEDNPKLAVEYVEHLSSFFRNIIGYKDVELISIEEELSLLNNYIFIQSKRYGESLNLYVNIDADLAKNNYIPPLTLQLLAENALKHNAISHETSLKIEITTEGEYLVIKNNINPKFTSEKSTGMGLQNIVYRYKILTENPVEIDHGTNHFTVKVPFIKKKKA